MKRINGLLILLAISFLFKSFGAVHYFSIDSLPGLSAVDLDSNKTINLMGRAQQQHPYDSSSNDFNPDFNADFAFSFGNLDPSCGGQLFLTYFQSYHVPDVNNIDTSMLVKRPRIDTLFEGEDFGPYYEIDNYYGSEYGSVPSFPPNDPVNEFYLIRTNKNHFSILRIKELISTYFDPSSLCYMKNAIKIEWWVQDDGNFNELCQIVNVIHKNNLRINSKVLTLDIFGNSFDLMGRKCLNPISSGFSIIQNQFNRTDKYNSIIHFHGYQK